ncbi:uncharacterized protein METZ01_LOCUS376697 [marine metagenome]|uniref:Uncharacterized protein n=1 Tax=marine metagenome TaxID=408172 RepID=A0A382TPF2_9ZZZZ
MTGEANKYYISSILKLFVLFFEIGDLIA